MHLSDSQDWYISIDVNLPKKITINSNRVWGKVVSRGIDKTRRTLC